MFHGESVFKRCAKERMKEDMSRRGSLRPRPVPVDVKAQKDVKAEAIVKEDSFIEQNDNGEDKKDDGNETSAEKESLVKARVLAAKDESGKSIFGFKTPKRKEALAKAAQESIHSVKKSGKQTLKSSSRLQKEKVQQTNKKNVEEFKRCRGHINVVSLALNEVEGSSSDEDSSIEDEISDDEEQSATQGKKTSGDLLDEYFEAQHNKRRQITSDKTLSKLANPKMDQQELKERLQEVQSRHTESIIALQEENKKHFDKWMFQMLSGFNIILYGVGSKYNLLEIFRKNFLREKLHIVINGFFPSLTIKQILNLITDDILDADASFKNVIDQASYIAKHFDNDDEKLFLVINNIDGHMLRLHNTQSVLGQLAASRNIHVIASIDHINAPLIWDQNRCSAFNWLWYDTTTFEPYNEETSYENSLMVQQTGTLALSSLTHVMRSLTPNAKGIFHLLVQYQLDNEDNSSYTGITFVDLYTRCREKFLVNSDTNLRAQLTEFKDHKLIKVKKGYDGIEYLTVTLDSATIRQYMETVDL